MSLQETEDPSAALWLDEIQDAILKANQDTQEALQCKSKHILLNNVKLLHICLFLPLRVSVLSPCLQLSVNHLKLFKEYVEDFGHSKEYIEEFNVYITFGLCSLSGYPDYQ